MNQRLSTTPDFERLELRFLLVTGFSQLPTNV